MSQGRKECATTKRHGRRETAKKEIRKKKHCNDQILRGIETETSRGREAYNQVEDTYK